MARFVVDANRIVSALLRDGATRKAIQLTDAELYAPEYLVEEVDRLLPVLSQRTGVALVTMQRLVAVLSLRIHWVAFEDYRPFMERANKAMGAIDIKDVPYLACALAVQADAIWSFDIDFDAQSLVPRIPHPDALLP